MYGMTKEHPIKLHAILMEKMSKVTVLKISHTHTTQHTNTNTQHTNTSTQHSSNGFHVKLLPQWISFYPQIEVQEDFILVVLLIIFLISWSDTGH